MLRVDGRLGRAGTLIPAGKTIGAVDWALPRECARRVFCWTPGRSAHGKPPDARRALEGARDRSPRGDQGLCGRVDPDLPGQDRQDPVPGTAPGARRDAAAPLALLARYLRAATLRREPPDEAAFAFLAPALAGFLPWASATLARSSSIRSTTGAVSATGSGAAISLPASFASSSARRSRL